MKMIPSLKEQNLVYHVLEYRAQVKELAESRGQALHTSLMISNFTRATTQVRGPFLAYYVVQFEVTVTL